MLVQVIDKKSPFYGLQCEIISKSGELYHIKESGADWHTGYVKETQIIHIGNKPKEEE